MLTLRSISQGVRALSPSLWNGLGVAPFPHLRHEFLAALETQNCLGPNVGWSAMPWLIEGPGAEVLGAVPVYLKETSFGDFSSDWHWARAYQQQGRSFYPKLVVASPFTPATGPKILAANEGLSAAHRVEVFELMREAVNRLGASALQFLFAPAEEFQDLPLIERHGCQFHWHNPGYRDFADFLDQLTSRRRKEILRERRQVREAGIELVARCGSSVTEGEWALFHQFYVRTFEHYGNYPALTEPFFRALGDTMGDQVCLVMAHRGEHLVAAAFFLVGASVLYGRYWGTLEALPALHFEACYYQGIELAIARRLSTFEPGAQGEHKISRGFLPQRTLSYHWIRHPGFRAAIARHVKTENLAMAEYMSACLARSPYREERG